MLWYHSLLLGIVQGLTEFLPVSSSGHLVFIPLVLGWQQQSLFFDVMLHLGTALALILYFRKDLLSILRGITGSPGSSEAKLGYYILLGSLPAGILGYLYEDRIETDLRSGLYVASFLILGSILMFSAEVIGRKNVKNGVNGLKALTVGFFQALALLPGISRSGATISGGMIMKIKREQAARFSFLLSIPVVVGASIFKAAEFFSAPKTAFDPVNLFIGLLSSFVVGYMAIGFLLKFLKNHTLFVFIVYRLILAGLLVVYFR